MSRSALIPLEQGSNFRDIGGYAGADGRHVHWGLIYRSAGQPLLAPGDVEQVKGLGIDQIVDLRSSEERVIAPTKILGVPYAAVELFDERPTFSHSPGSATVHNGRPISTASSRPRWHPSSALIFAHLLHRSTPIVYSARRGRTAPGFVTAIILSALRCLAGTRSWPTTILSTKYRRPEFELPQLDPCPSPTIPSVRQLASYQQRPDWKTPQPLHDEQGSLSCAARFAEIDARWGSVDQYLATEVGVSAADLATLRRAYLQ